MAERNISEEDIARTLSHPQNTLPAKKGRTEYQSLLVRDNRILLLILLLRVFVDFNVTPPLVVSVIATTQGKYWR